MLRATYSHGVLVELQFGPNSVRMRTDIYRCGRWRWQTDSYDRRYLDFWRVTSTLVTILTALPQLPQFILYFFKYSPYRIICKCRALVLEYTWAYTSERFSHFFTTKNLFERNSKARFRLNTTKFLEQFCTPPAITLTTCCSVNSNIWQCCKVSYISHNSGRRESRLRWSNSSVIRNVRKLTQALPVHFCTQLCSTEIDYLKSLATQNLAKIRWAWRNCSAFFIRFVNSTNGRRPFGSFSTFSAWLKWQS